MEPIKGCKESTWRRVVSLPFLSTFLLDKVKLFPLRLSRPGVTNESLSICLVPFELFSVVFFHYFKIMINENIFFRNTSYLTILCE